MTTRNRANPVEIAALAAAGAAVGDVAAKYAQLVSASQDPLGSGLVESLRQCVPAALADPTFPLTQATVGLGVAGAALPWALWAYSTSRRGNYRPGEEHGSARWVTDAQLAGYADRKEPLDNVILSRRVRLALGRRGFDLEHDKSPNLLVVGGPGSGKTRYVVKPNLMQLNASFVVTDPKGTLLPETAGMFERAGYAVRVLNVMNFENSMHFNPLAYVREQEDIASIVTCLVQNAKPEGAGKGQDPFWEQMEMQLLRACIAFLVETKPRRDWTMRNVIRMVRLISVDEGNSDAKSDFDRLFDAYRTGSGGRSDFPRECRDLMPPAGVRADESSYALVQYDQFRISAGKTLKSIVSTLNSDLGQFSLSKVLDLTDTDDLALDTIGGLYDADLDRRAAWDEGVLRATAGGLGLARGATPGHPGGQRKTILYIVFDDGDSTFNFLVATCLHLCFRVLKSYADRSGERAHGRLPIPVQFYLDEFGNLGKVADFRRLITTVRSRNIGITMILQELSQLESVYGKEDANIISGACPCWIYLGATKLETAKTFSEMAGNETVNNRNGSRSYGEHRSSSDSEQIVQRPLITPDEVLKLSPKLELLYVAGAGMARVEKYVIQEHPNYALIDPGHAGKARFAAWVPGEVRRPGTLFDLWGVGWPPAELDEAPDVRALARSASSDAEKARLREEGAPRAADPRLAELYADLIEAIEGSGRQ